MGKPIYDIGDNVCAVYKTKDEITIIRGTVDAIEITKHDIKYLVVYNKVQVLYISEDKLFTTVRAVTNKVANLLEE